MKTREIIFDWKQNGSNNGEPILELEILGIPAKIYKSYDNNLWSTVVNHSGERGFVSEEEAKQYAESDINNRINKRVNIAISDLKLFTDLFDEIVDNV